MKAKRFTWSVAVLVALAAFFFLSGCSGCEHEFELTLENPPSKTTYLVGEPFSAEGMSVKRHCIKCGIYEDGDISVHGGEALVFLQESVEMRDGELRLEVPVSVKVRLDFSLCAVGDSLTEGMGVAPEDAYPMAVRQFFTEDSDIRAVNCGISGACFHMFSDDNPCYLDTEQYRTSLETPCDYLVVMLGTNDANNWENEKDVYESDLKALIAGYQSTYPDAVIIVMTSPPCKENSYGVPNDIIQNEVVPIQIRVSQELGVELLDLNAAFQALDQTTLNRFYFDGLHFRKPGYAFVARCVAEKIYNLNSSS